MDWKIFIIGLTLILSGILILLLQKGDGDFTKRFKINNETFHLVGAVILCIGGGLWMLIKAF